MTPEAQSERDRITRLLRWRRDIHRMWAGDPSLQKYAFSYLDTVGQLDRLLADIEAGGEVPSKADEAAAYKRTPEPPTKGGPIQLAAGDKYDTDAAFKEQVDILFQMALRSMFGESQREELAKRLAFAFGEAFASRNKDPKKKDDESEQKSLI